MEKYIKLFIRVLSKKIASLLKTCFINYIIRPILNLMVANDRNEDIPEKYFSFSPSPIPRGFRTDIVEKCENSNHKTNFKF